MFEIVAIFLSIAALASFLNYRYVRLPSTIGLMVIGLSLSLLVIGLNVVGLEIETLAFAFLSRIDFGEALMKGMLCFLLFAGALKINLNDLAKQKYVVSALATIGVVVTTFLVGTALFLMVRMLQLDLPYAFCLVFGALIAPTDPVAVLAILKSVKAPKSLETKIAGESLFNDGVGVVIFTVLAGIATATEATSFGSITWLFVKETVGGIVFGLTLGLTGFRMLRDVHDHTVEVLITLAMVCGGYALALHIHVSGPIAIVVAGLLTGNYGRRLAMSPQSREHLDSFWELIDEILNAVLFIWIGFEILVLSYSVLFLVLGLIAIPLTLAARLTSVWGVINVLKFRRQFSHNAIRILTWGGLRGGISIALALSLPPGPERDLIVSVTYVVVVFSILVQGMTMKHLVKKR